MNGDQLSYLVTSVNERKRRRGRAREGKEKNWRCCNRCLYLIIDKKMIYFLCIDRFDDFIIALCNITSRMISISNKQRRRGSRAICHTSMCISLKDSARIITVDRLVSVFLLTQQRKRERENVLLVRTMTKEIFFLSIGEDGYYHK